ncbi:MAG: DUF4342 domain-containing protein [Lachnospiraceae bacterium]
MEENKINNEEIIVTEEEKVVEAPKAEEPAAEEPAVEETTTDAPAAEEPQSEGAAEEPAAEEPATEEEPLTDDDLKKFADDMVSKIKELVAEGNVSRIRIRKGDTIILNLPLSVGLIGTALGLVAAPWAVILGTISTIGFKCTVEVEKKDGTVTIIHGKES